MSKLEILQRTINYMADLTESLHSDNATSPSKLAAASPPKRKRAPRTRKRKTQPELECRATRNLLTELSSPEPYATTTTTTTTTRSLSSHSVTPLFNDCVTDPVIGQGDTYSQQPCFYSSCAYDEACSPGFSDSHSSDGAELISELRGLCDWLTSQGSEWPHSCS